MGDYGIEFSTIIRSNLKSNGDAACQIGDLLCQINLYNEDNVSLSPLFDGDTLVSVELSNASRSLSEISVVERVIEIASDHSCQAFRVTTSIDGSLYKTARGSVEGRADVLAEIAFEASLHQASSLECEVSQRVQDDLKIAFSNTNVRVARSINALVKELYLNYDQIPDAVRNALFEYEIDMSVFSPISSPDINGSSNDSQQLTGLRPHAHLKLVGGRDL